MSDITTSNCAVKIAVRERPARKILNMDDSLIRYSEEADNVLYVDNRPFAFDYILNDRVIQEELYDELIRPLVEKVKCGFNCTALAYGQTGTGKSYTMGLSCEKLDGEHAGIVTRCLSEFFELIETEQEEEKKLSLSVSFIEIYNEKLYDLLSDNYSEPIVSRGYRFTGGVRKVLTSLEDCQRILMESTKNRHVRPTVMNNKSSRSHAIFTIHVRNRSNPLHPTTACLNLVDLAGSEGIRRTGHQGMAMSEGVTINKGLLSIGKVLHALSTGLKVIPYRDSVLSSVLQDSLNPNSFLTLIACISPDRVDLSETLSTLRFAQNAKQLKHTPNVNIVYSAKKKPLSRISCLSNLNQHRKTLGGAIIKAKKVANRIHNTVNGKLESTIVKQSQSQNEDVTFINSQSSTLSLERTFDLEYPSFVGAVPSNALVTSTNQKPKPKDIMSVMNDWKDIMLQTLGNKENVNHDEAKTMMYNTLQEICRTMVQTTETAPVLAVTTNVPANIEKVKCQLEPALDPVFRMPVVPKSITSPPGTSIDIEPSHDSTVSSTLLQDTPNIMNTRRITRSTVNNQLLQTAGTDIKVVPVKKERKVAKKKVGKHTLEVILEGGAKSSKFNRTNHRKVILNILNTSSLNELKLLPRIGAKTAYQIILFRSARGPFKNLKQVENLPVWKTKKMWENFATANMLD